MRMNVRNAMVALLLLVTVGAVAVANDYYNHGSFPAPGSPATSAGMRAELDLITTGFDKLPAISGNANEHIAVNSGGTALTSIPYGHIPFPATQNPSADANTLDDYEEGNWTPSVGGNATYHSQLGTYTKIGRLVTLHCSMSINAIGTGNTVTITGVPVASGAERYATGAVYFTNSATSVVTVVAHMGATASQIELYSLTAAGQTLSFANPIFGNNTTIRFTLTYSVS